MSNNMFQEDIQDRREFTLKYARPLGWFMFTGGLVLGLVFIVLPIWQAQRGESRVMISFVGAAGSVIALCVSPGYIIGGRRFVELIWPPAGQWKFANVLAMVICCLICLGAYLGLRAYLAAHGCVV